MRIRVAAFLVLFFVTGCSGRSPEAASANEAALGNSAPTSTDNTDRPVSGPATRTGTWYQAGDYRVRSLMPGVFIVPVKDLPQVRYEGDQDSSCGTLYKTPATAEGKWARSRGWRVGAETRLGQLTLVNVMRRYHYETQACGQRDGKIILFRGGRPLAAIRVASPERSDTLAIETLDAQENGAVRLKNQWVVPFGDLVVSGRDIEIRALPASDLVCRGKLIVPNIFGRPIRQARVALGSAGWKPATTRPPVYTTNPDGSLTVEDTTHFELYKQGITEVSGCAPTGFCDFEYRSKGAKLTLSTMGESAVGYSIVCQG